jgi:hypothetical protein
VSPGRGCSVENQANSDIPLLHAAIERRQPSQTRYVELSGIRPMICLYQDRFSLIRFLIGYVQSASPGPCMALGVQGLILERPRVFHEPPRFGMPSGG